MKWSSRFPRFAVVAALVPILAGCGGGEVCIDCLRETGGSTAGVTVSQGVFLDTYVDGMRFETESRNNLTGGSSVAAGAFRYEDGETVTFSVGGIVIGSAPAAPVITPIELVGGSADINTLEVLNIARFLQSLDEDGNPDNGILITEDTRTSLQNQSLDFGAGSFAEDAQNLLDAVLGGGTLVSTDDAREHFQTTLNSLAVATGRITVDGDAQVAAELSGEPTQHAATFPDNQTIISWTYNTTTQESVQFTTRFEDDVPIEVTLLQTVAGLNSRTYSCGTDTPVEEACVGVTLNPISQAINFDQTVLLADETVPFDDAVGEITIDGELRYSTLR